MTEDETKLLKNFRKKNNYVFYLNAKILKLEKKLYTILGNIKKKKKKEIIS